MSVRLSCKKSMFITWSNNKEEKIVWKENSWFFSTVLLFPPPHSIFSFDSQLHTSLQLFSHLSAINAIAFSSWKMNGERAQQHAITARLKLIYTTSLPTNQRLMLSHSLHVIISVPMFAHLLWVRAVWERPARVQWCFQCACGCIMCFCFFGWLMSDPLELIQRRWSVAVQAKQQWRGKWAEQREVSKQTQRATELSFIRFDLLTISMRSRSKRDW